MTAATPGDGGRRAQGQRTRLGILRVAREQFHRLGYDGASIRSIAAAADIDPSMVMRYYGSKEGLFAAAVDIDLRLPDLGDSPAPEWGHRMVQHFLSRWESEPSDEVLVLLLRSALSNESARTRMVTVFAEQLTTAVARVSGPDTAARRAVLIASQMLGLALCRYVLALPGAAAAPPQQLVADLGPTLQRYLTDPLPQVPAD